eukprot:CAMPEP_0177666396 /NCGR_PEP_ID=MMETSP0447-20121125/21564_1 /TAXON_ID=0 /ORGANISM="Stygamoeba regulata, Strain BSH-02190019" /LENGTH=418 /DNA_ID=CAMNT_0019172551 /DNA_START=147 /DNA_END=1403 /DNA_ORIENTATION=+
MRRILSRLSSSSSSSSETTGWKRWNLEGSSSCHTVSSLERTGWKRWNLVGSSSCHTVASPNHDSSGQREPIVGVALGSGAARGWAHIGVLRALEANGIRPQVIAGCSMGALVGAAAALGRLDTLEREVRSISYIETVKLVDIAIFGGSGLMSGSSILRHLSSVIPEDADFQHLRRTFGAVAADIRTGREVWLREGLLMNAVRASIAVPGIFTPHLVGDDWLVDGGIVNPVPVSLCRAMGAEVVIAVNLNRNLCGRNFRSERQAERVGAAVSDQRPTLDEVVTAHATLSDEQGAPDLSSIPPASSSSSSWNRLMNTWRDTTSFLRDSATGGASNASRSSPSDRRSAPGLLAVMSASLNILQDRITRSRLAGDPPDIEVCPRLADVDFHQLHRGDVAIEEGARATEKMMALIKDALDAAR